MADLCKLDTSSYGGRIFGRRKSDADGVNPYPASDRVVSAPSGGRKKYYLKAPHFWPSFSYLSQLMVNCSKATAKWDYCLPFCGISSLYHIPPPPRSGVGGDGRGRMGEMEGDCRGGGVMEAYPESGERGTV